MGTSPFIYLAVAAASAAVSVLTALFTLKSENRKSEERNREVNEESRAVPSSRDYIDATTLSQAIGVLRREQAAMLDVQRINQKIEGVADIRDHIRFKRDKNKEDTKSMERLLHLG